MAEYTKIETARVIICDLCESLYPDGYFQGKCGSGKCDWMEYLKEDAADVAPVVHGHFVHDGPRFTGGVDWWHCSNCGRLASGVEIRFAYCPWCGARMDGDGDA